MRAVEREGRYLNPKAITRSRLHLIAAYHNPRRRRQRSATGVLEAFARSEHRLLADDPRATHFLHPTMTVRDLPVTVAELDSFFPSVFDADVVGPNVMAFRRRGTLLEINWFHRDFDRSGGFRVHRLYPLFPSRHDRQPRLYDARPAQCRRSAESRQDGRAGAKRSSTRSAVMSGESGGLIGWMQTWSAPASQCCWIRARIAPLSPHATIASRKRSEPPPARSLSPNPWRRQART